MCAYECAEGRSLRKTVRAAKRYSAVRYAGRRSRLPVAASLSGGCHRCYAANIRQRGLWHTRTPYRHGARRREMAGRHVRRELYREAVLPSLHALHISPHEVVHKVKVKEREGVFAEGPPSSAPPAVEGAATLLLPATPARRECCRSRP